jgi:hypothetical protein
MKNNIVYEPTAKQNYFHTLSDDYIVLGGSRGSGKSECLLIEALGLAYNSHNKGHWQALILRRTIPQLQELITRAKYLYPEIIKDVKYKSQQNIFEFPNGSYVQFSSCERDEDVEKFRGREFNFIGIDEGSHFESDYVFQWLKSCNRNSYDYPNRIVITSNPCKWIKNICKVDDYGNDTIQKVIYVDTFTKETVIKTLRFVQMNIETNPHLGAEYRAALDQDIVHRDQWLLGLWKDPPVPGQVLEAELKHMELEHRYMPLQMEQALPVHVFTDLGYSDNTSLVFVQFLNNNINIIDFYENSQCSVDNYILEISTRYGDKAIVHLPHDGAVHESNGETRRDYWKARIKVAEDSGPTQNLPNLSNIESFSRVKAGFRRIYINSQKCEELYDRLKQYRRRWNADLRQFGDPIHDINSHAFDAVKYIFYYDPPKKTKWVVPNTRPSSTIW